MAAESDDPKYPFKSTGAKEVEDPIRLDGGKEFKGKLHYQATFIPALSLKGVKFDAEENELQKVEHGESDSEGGYVDTISTVSDDEEETNEVTFKKGHTKAAKSTDTTKTANTVGTQGTNASTSAPLLPDGPTAEDATVSMTTEELLQQRTFFPFPPGSFCNSPCYRIGYPGFLCRVWRPSQERPNRSSFG